MIEQFSPNCNEDDCCKKLVQPFIDHLLNFTIELEYKNGEKITIAPWEASEVIESSNEWTVVRQNTPAYEDIDTSELTQKSKILYGKHHHWGKMEFYKMKKCPLKY